MPRNPPPELLLSEVALWPVPGPVRPPNTPPSWLTTLLAVLPTAPAALVAVLPTVLPTAPAALPTPVTALPTPLVTGPRPPPAPLEGIGRVPTPAGKAVPPLSPAELFPLPVVAGPGLAA